jgi:hypothetical protein
MLAEIFMLRLEAAARAAKEAITPSRFVPITLPAAKHPNPASHSKYSRQTQHALDCRGGRARHSAPSLSPRAA